MYRLLNVVCVILLTIPKFDMIYSLHSLPKQDNSEFWQNEFRQQTEKFKEQNIKSLQTFCPLTSFCEEKPYQNRSTSTEHSIINVPCCQPCSCASSCVHLGNCCFRENVTNNVIRPIQECRHTFVKEPFDINAAIHYNMIVTCTNRNNTCKDKDAGPFGSFFPVLSKQTKHVYYNKYCAICRNAREIVPFSPVIKCNDELTPHTLAIFIQNTNSFLENNTNSCEIFFRFPIHAQEHNAFFTNQCFSAKNRVINSCSKTYSGDPILHELCKSVHAPFLQQDRYTMSSVGVYENVFCFLCSDELHTMYNNHWCYYKNELSLSAFTKLIEITFDEIIVPTEELPVTCFFNTMAIKHHCRMIHCPEGQVRFQKGCKYPVDTWQSFVYKLMFLIDLKLTLIDSHSNISLSSLIAVTNRQENISKMFVTSQMRDWYQEIYVSVQNNTFIDFLVLKAAYISLNVSMREIIKRVNKTFTSVWYIDTNKGKLPFNVAFYEKKFNLYTMDESKREFSRIVTDNETTIAYGLHRISPLVIETKGRAKRVTWMYELSRFNLCEQIEFQEEDLIDFGDTIYLNLTSQYFSSGEFQRTIDHLGKPTYRICLSDVHVSRGYSGTNTVYFKTLFLFQIVIIAILHQ